MEKKKVLRRIISLVIVIILAFVGVHIEARIPKKRCTNPYSSVIVRGDNRDALTSLSRVGTSGYLYEITFDGDFETTAPTGLLGFIRMLRVRGGCTSFVLQTTGGTPMLASNYDYPHLNDAGEPTGVLVAVHCKPDGKYASVGLADAYLLEEAGKEMAPGCLDDGTSDNSLLCLLPYLCESGINEKGLAVTIEYLPTKEGESPVNQKEKGKDRVLITQLVRILLDDCATVEEAQEKAAAVNLVNTSGNDYHLLVTDAAGSSAVFEWRYNVFAAVDADISTNFYLGYDDAADLYEDGQLKEAFPGTAKMSAAHRYGYGYGYARFNIVASAFDACSRASNGRAVMTEEKAASLLTQTRQTYTDELSSHTQCSILFDMEYCTMVVHPLPSYANAYGFGAKE